MRQTVFNKLTFETAPESSHGGKVIKMSKHFNITLGMYTRGGLGMLTGLHGDAKGLRVKSNDCGAST